MYCTTLQHTATTHCNSTETHFMKRVSDLCTAAHCNTLQQHTATALQRTSWGESPTYVPSCLSHTLLQTSPTKTHCNTLQHTATHCNTLQHTAAHCSTLQQHCKHTATHCNTLQHTVGSLRPIPHDVPSLTHERRHLCCSFLLQCVAICCSVLLQCATMCCSVLLQCVAMCCSACISCHEMKHKMSS